MDIIKHYSAYPQLKASASCQAGASRLDGRYTSLDEFVRQMEAKSVIQEQIVENGGF